MELRPHQQSIVDTAPNKYGLWLRMRVGKTPTIIRLACERRIRTCLIVCPKSLVKHWEKEIEMWKNWDTCFHIISREQFVKKYNTLLGYHMVAIDESHRGFGNYRSQMFKAMDSYIKRHNPSHIYLLSGTPFTSSSWSVYSYGKLLGKDWSWYKWSNHFFYKIKMGNKMIPKARTDRDEELQKILRNIGVVIDLKDVAEVADDEDVIENFDLNAEQKRCIKQYFDPTPIVNYTIQHQLESGSLKSDGYREEFMFECDKDKRIKELVEDNKKIVIVARYLKQIDKYYEMFKLQEKPVFMIRGDSKFSATEIAAQAEKAEEAIVLIQSDTCEGYSLKSFDTMVFASLSYSFVNYDQMKSRMKAMEKKTPNTYIHLLTSGDSMDKAVFDSVSKKQNFSIELYEKKR